MVVQEGRKHSNAPKRKGTNIDQGDGQPRGFRRPLVNGEPTTSSTMDLSLSPESLGQSRPAGKDALLQVAGSILHQQHDQTGSFAPPRGRAGNPARESQRLRSSVSVICGSRSNFPIRDRPHRHRRRAVTGPRSGPAHARTRACAMACHSVFVHWHRADISILEERVPLFGASTSDQQASKTVDEHHQVQYVSVIE